MPEFILPPPHPSVKESDPRRADSYDQIQIFRICPHGKVPYRRFNSPEASAHVQIQRKYGWEPSNRVCGGRGAAAHACAPGLSTGRRLMPMPARCGAAAPCRGAAMVRRSPHTRRILRRVLLGRGCLCGAHRARATASTTKRLHAWTCEGADENSWQSRPRHTHARNKVLLSAALVVCLQRRWRSRPSRNASAQRDGSLQREDGVRHCLLSCSRPAAT